MRKSIRAVSYTHLAVPVGFVNVVESKEELFAACAAHGVPAIAAMGRNGGSTVAAAVCNSLVYSAAWELSKINTSSDETANRRMLGSILAGHKPTYVLSLIHILFKSLCLCALHLISPFCRSPSFDLKL